MACRAITTLTRLTSFIISTLTTLTNTYKFVTNTYKIVTTVNNTYKHLQIYPLYTSF